MHTYMYRIALHCIVSMHMQAYMYASHCIALHALYSIALPNKKLTQCVAQQEAHPMLTSSQVKIDRHGAKFGGMQ